MDVAPFLEIKPAPAVLFDRAAQYRDQPRYMLPGDDGGWRPLSWAQHAASVRSVGSALARAGLKPGERVAIFAENSPQWMEAALGAQAAALVVVPVYPASTPEQAAHVAGHSDARVLFVAGEDLLGRVFEVWESLASVGKIVILDVEDPNALAESMREVGRPCPSVEWAQERVCAWADFVAQGEAHDQAHPDEFERRLASIDLDAPAIMLYTSGTTGPPKGVPLTHGNVGVNARDWLASNGPRLPENGIDVLWLPMSHIFGFGEACLGNNLGFTSYLSDPKSVFAVMPVVRPNVFMSVPAYWEKLAASSIGESDSAVAAEKLAAATGGRLQFCLSGGAGLSIRVKQHFERCGIVILEGYGLSECSPTLTLNRPGDYRFDSVGKPLPSVELMLAEDGEILARGPSVFSGYHKDPESTQAAFNDEGWFKTGDIGRWTEDGFLQIIDRKKEILVTAGGKNVPPANIERLFAGDPLFAHVVVYGDARKYLVAGVWLQTGVLAERLRALGKDPSDPAAREELVQVAVDAANSKLARYEQVKRFCVIDQPLTVENGLLTSTLKIRRKKIYAAFDRAFEDLYT